MRIQHYIMVISAYRNYTNNVSAMKKNLERLSSGYKINRAGDTDRYQLQKEVNQLREEINRIADSANFNGIKLLDGSMDGDAIVSSITGTGGESVNATVGGVLTAVANNPYADLGVNTVLHQTADSEDGGSTFGIAFHDFTFNNQVGDTLKIEVGEGDNKLTIELKVSDDATRTGAASKKLTGQDLVDAILHGTDTDATGFGIIVTINGTEWAEGDEFEISGQLFKFGQSSGDGVLTLVQKEKPTDESEIVDASMKVKISGNIAATKAQYTVTLDPADWVSGDTLVIDGKEFDITAAATTPTLAELKTLLNGQETDNYELSLDDSDGTLTITAKNTGKAESPVEVGYVKKDAALTVTKKDEGEAGAYATISGSKTMGASACTSAEVSIGDKSVTIAHNESGKKTITVDDVTYNITIDNNNVKIEADSFGDYDHVFTIKYSGGTDDGVSEDVTVANGKDEVKATATVDLTSWTSGTLRADHGGHRLRRRQPRGGDGLCQKAGGGPGAGAGAVERAGLLPVGEAAGGDGRPDRVGHPRQERAGHCAAGDGVLAWHHVGKAVRKKDQRE